MPKITIDNQTLRVKKGTTIIEACKQLGIEIPTLCYIKELNEIGFCRICSVEVEGQQDLVTACNTEVEKGMVVHTDSQQIRDSRKTSLELLASKHRFDCWTCPKDGICEFYDMLKEHDVVFEDFEGGEGRYNDFIPGTGISQDQTKCILCKRCVAVCNDVVTARVLKFRDEDGLNPVVSPTPELSFDETACIFCGECVNTCPTGALQDTLQRNDVQALLEDDTKEVVLQLEPTVYRALEEELGCKEDLEFSEIKRRIHHALHICGFEEVTNASAFTDVYIKKQSQELLERLNSEDKKMLLTSMDPAAVRYTELFQESYVDAISTLKSPHMISGALIKQHYAKTHLNKSPEDIAVVSVMPTPASKHEIAREEHQQEHKDVDAVLNVRELATIIKVKGLALDTLKLRDLDIKLAELNNVHLTFQRSGTNLEEVLKETAATLGVEMPELKYKLLVGKGHKYSEGKLKEAKLKLKDYKLRVAIAIGGNAIKELFKRIEAGVYYDFVEYQASNSGCSIFDDNAEELDIPSHDIIQRRMHLLCSELEETAHDTKYLDVLYKEFLNDKNESILYTSYSPKEYTKE